MASDRGALRGRGARTRQHSEKGKEKEEKVGLAEIGTYESVLQIFRKYDKDGNGLISFRELHLLMCDLNKGNWSEAESDRLFLKLDKNRSGSIDVNEFLRYIFGTDVNTAPAGKSEYERVLETFLNFDFNRNGTLDKAEFTRLMTTLTNGDWCENRTEAVFTNIDKDHSGEVDMTELLAFLFDIPNQHRRGSRHGHAHAGLVVVEFTCAPGQPEVILQQIANIWAKHFGTDLAVKKIVARGTTGISRVTAQDGNIVFWDSATMVAFRENPFVNPGSLKHWVEDMSKRHIPQLLASARTLG